MDIKIVCIGKIKEKFYINSIDEMTKLLNRGNVKFSIVQIIDEPIPKKSGQSIEDKVKNIEGSKMLSSIKDDEYVIGLCIDGKEVKTSEHKQIVKKAYDNGYNKITYVIGGSLGTSEELRKRMNYKLSFSKMTLPHQLMRVVLVEELTNVYL